MKNINFKRKESAIRVGVEETRKTPKKPINWDRIIYFIILTIALFFLVRYIINSTLYIEAVGQVRFENVKIRNTDDSRIMEFHVAAGDEVKVGDSLFTYIDNDNFGAMNAGLGLNGKFNAVELQDKSPTWIERELFNLEKDIAVRQSMYSENKKLITFYTNQAKKVEEQVILDVVPKSEYTNYIDRKNKLIGENSAIAAEIGIYKTQYDILKSRLKIGKDTVGIASGIGSGSGGGDGLDSLKRVFYSPMEGTITEVFKAEFEVALKSENILSIHKPENVYIKAFFDQEDLKELAENDIVTLTFPDGTESEGYIKKFYFSTYLIPEEFQNKYEPPTRTLSADVYPVNIDDLNKWRKFYKMRVKITKGKL